jgi:hypothetical protein
MKVYYAHCISLYDTPQEARDLLHLEMLGFDVINPNSQEVEQRCDNVRQAHKDYYYEGSGATTYPKVAGFAFDNAGGAVMELVFKPMISPAKIDGVVFRALPDGRIPAGVAQEIKWANERGLPIIELPTFAYDRVMSVELTRVYLHETGAR